MSPRPANVHGHRTSRAAAMRDLRAAAGVVLGQQPAHLPLPLPPRPFQRDYVGPGPAEEHLRPRGPHPGAPARPPGNRRSSRWPQAPRTRHGVRIVRPVSEHDLIGCLRAREITLIYDPHTKTLQADTPKAAAAITSRAS